MNQSPVPFFSSARENGDLLDTLLEQTAAILQSGKVLQGEAVEVFEEKVATMCGRRHAIAVGSGTDAISFALFAAGIGPGDEVLCPDISFVASASAIARTGATPVFVDIADDCMMDLDAAATHLTPRTRALLFVHLFGSMRNPASLIEFASKHGLLLFEDAAQGFGARYLDRPCGASGVAAAVSFDPTKVIGAPGSGGAVLTDDLEIAESVRRLRYHGRSNGVSVALGYNCQMPTVTAAMLCAKLERHNLWTTRRAAIACRYSEAFSAYGIPTVPVDPNVTHVWHKYVIRTAGRNALTERLRMDGVPTAIHYPTPLHREPVFGLPQDADRAFPVAMRHAATALSLPIHAYLSDEEVDRIIFACIRYH